MANFLSKIKINTAVDKHSKLDLSCDHITTQDFFKVRPVYFRELVPGQSIDINHSCFVRLAPLAKPMYGNVRMVNRAFFVPMRTIFPHWNDFITDTLTTINGQTSKVSSVPYVYNSFIANYIAGTAPVTTSSYATTVTGDIVPDFEIEGSTQGTKIMKRLTDKGRRALTILQSLGYNISWASSFLSDANPTMSLLPLLAFAKIKADWYTLAGYPSQAQTLEAAITHFSNGGSFGSANADYNAFGDILNELTNANYDQDYFTACWDRPSMPNNADGGSAVQINDITNDKTGTGYGSLVNSSTSASSSIPTTPALVGKSSGGVLNVAAANTITQYALDALKSLTDYVKRHQLVGGRALDRMLARFGVTLESEKLNRSVYLGSTSLNIQISDVMSTSDTTGAALGDYAGKGIGFDQNGHFSYKTDEYGYIIIISTILPKIGYVQGLNKNLQHISRLDFYTPEFDNLGVQAVAVSELYNDAHTADEAQSMSSASWNSDGVFGYLPRYAEYKVGNDFLTGDFRFDSKNANLDTYHLNRMFYLREDTDADEVMSHSADFCTGNQVDYDRIFSTQTDNGAALDHFYSIHHFDVSTYAPMTSLFDNYEFADKGREVTETIGGTQLN